MCALSLVREKEERERRTERTEEQNRSHINYNDFRFSSVLHQLPREPSTQGSAARPPQATHVWSVLICTCFHMTFVRKLFDQEPETGTTIVNTSIVTTSSELILCSHTDVTPPGEAR